MASASPRQFPNPDDHYAAAEDAAYEHYMEEQSKKKNKINEPREWVEVNQWNRENHSVKNIKTFIRKEFDELNLSSYII
jgi:predicted acetyltransferase